ncbi:MAG TPA: hypothetical protein DC017_16910 [Candidatus Wallbacteria bacterium]|nr:hypothetical protein [Candidatus Wallbacteria bacterium]
MKKRSGILLAIAGYLALFTFHWLYCCQYDWDVTADVLLVHKYNNFSLAGVHPRAILLPVLVYPFAYFIDPLYFLIFLSAISLAATLYLFDDILSPYVSFKIRLISAVAFVSCRAFYVTAHEMDDNFFQLPLLLLAFKIFLSRRADLYNASLAGFITGLAASVHIQALTFIPALAAGYFFKTAVAEGGGAKKSLKISATAVTAAIVPFGVLAAGLFYLNGEGFSAGLSSYYSDQRFSAVARDFSLSEIILHAALYIVFTAHNLLPVPRPFSYGADLFLHSAAIFALPVFLAAVFFPAASKNKNGLESSFFRSNNALIGLACVFNFLYEPGSHERWSTVSPFFYFNFALGLKIILDNLPAGVKGFLKKVFPAAAAAALLISAAVISTSFVYKAQSAGKDFYAYPNYSSMKAIAAACSDNEAPLIAGFDVPWMMVSYLRPGPVVYQNGSIIHEITRGAITTYKTADDLKLYLKRFRYFYFHEAAYAFVVKHFAGASGRAVLCAELKSDDIFNDFFNTNGTHKIYRLDNTGGM